MHVLQRWCTVVSIHCSVHWVGESHSNFQPGYSCVLDHLQRRKKIFSRPFNFIVDREIFVSVVTRCLSAADAAMTIAESDLCDEIHALKVDPLLGNVGVDNRHAHEGAAGPEKR